ncbi:hypothetical protein ACLIMP_21030 [Novosphingobium aerophilum]|uniref:hypothetical protein n=1 Tax=Novosphingobium TaxID=165696 RepID=UPI0006C8BFEF|nr:MULTISPECIES: hypothetical protein [unclassified Novosphingobium]KPH66225.1 hypothetical protein ADT71_07270 [Novosphingobium sp. ST904]MPS70038.1 hypothetical protein [Novosphingobium sp.]TCM38826.1 hypothetical protein EDF59_107134 [Novosphingobium sp. ST904]WRT95742.1 hypothetical protein U9J33_19250 [Novosphingobium sp. RL4]
MSVPDGRDGGMVMENRMDYELISTTCVPAPIGFFIVHGDGDPAKMSETSQILAWRIDTFRIPGQMVPMSVTWPVTLNGAVEDSDLTILRPDGLVEYPDNASSRESSDLVRLSSVGR